MCATCVFIHTYMSPLMSPVDFKSIKFADYLVVQLRTDDLPNTLTPRAAAVFSNGES